MTIKECIDIVDNLKPNQYTIKEKVMWLSFIEAIIINDVLKTHEGYDGKYDLFEGYSEDKLSLPLIVPSPYDRLYTEYLKMKIDEANGETARYNNSASMFNMYMTEYKKHYNKTHMPLTGGRRVSAPNKVETHMVSLTDAEYENIKRDLTYIMTEYFGNLFSEDKISDIVNTFIKNNVAMLKGKDGKDGVDGKDGINGNDGKNGRDGAKGDKGDKPILGVDYFTDVDKANINKYIDEQTKTIKSDVDGIQKSILNEAHFRGYLSTNDKIQVLSATPNDFAYSAESNTKWVYDERNGWINTGIKVPDQLTPASDSSPLIDGVASPGSEESYARGDHRHPTDTTRASVTAFNKLESDVHPAIQLFENQLIANKVYRNNADRDGNGINIPVPVGENNTEVDISVHNQVLLYLKTTALEAVTWAEGLQFVDGKIPTIGVGCYRVIFEYNPNSSAWVVGVIQDGAVS